MNVRELRVVLEDCCKNNPITSRTDRRQDMIDDRASKPSDVEVMEIVENVGSGKITFAEACEIIETENAKLEEYMKLQSEDIEELDSEKQKLKEYLKFATLQSKLVEITDLVEEEKEVSEQSTLLDSIHKMICHHLNNFLEDGLPNRCSGVRARRGKKSLHDILKYLIPDLKTGTVPTEDIILKTDDSMKEYIDTLLAMGIIEKLPDDPTRVKLCKEYFINLHE